jgi:hypothetical protein
MDISKLCVAALLTLMPIPAQADDGGQSEIYQSLMSCAAFHTIEATKAQGDAAAAQQASAYDFAEAAVLFAPDGRTVTANDDLKVMLDNFQEKLNTGDTRDMAEQWTGLESACLELHSAKDALVAKRKREQVVPNADKPGEPR